MKTRYKIEDVEKVTCPMVNRTCAGEWCPAYVLAVSPEREATIKEEAYDTRAKLMEEAPRDHFQCGMSSALGYIANAAYTTHSR